MQEENSTFEIFSSRLKRVMTEKGITTSQLASLANVGQATLSNYTLGKREPKAAELYRISKALGVSMEWLFSGMTGDTHSSNLTDIEKENIQLKAKLKMAVSALKGALKTLESR